MKVISGSKKGHNLKAAAGKKMRPTSGRVRSALFDILGPDLADLCVLDLFCGSGALGIEALSRGARNAVFVDSGRDSAKYIKQNLDALCFLEQARIMPKKAGAALKLLAAEKQKFDLVFLDPPYKSPETGKTLRLLSQLELLNPEADIVVEHDSDNPLKDAYDGMELYDRRNYGRTILSFYRNTEGG
ncbi:MAG: 16S rRNA (guanine(966)-N(2))-methyltransferase RsmD [bacterium]